MSDTSPFVLHMAATKQWRAVIKRSRYGEPDSIVIEVPDGTDALGETRWRSEFLMGDVDSGHYTVPFIRAAHVLALLRALLPRHVLTNAPPPARTPTFERDTA